MEKIKIEQLNFRYPTSKNNALNDINLSINKSEFIVLCGKSGCGKSTLLRHLKSQISPYGDRTGNIYIDGQKIENMDNLTSAAKIGFIQQNPDNQIVTDVVSNELGFGLENLGVQNDVMKRKVGEMANYFGIQTWFRKKTSQLSGGQKQLVNLASIMAMQPEILILDEPTSQLDPIATSEFLNTLRKINQDLGVTVIISEHRLEEIMPMADKILVMEEGRIIVNDRPNKIANLLIDSRTGEKNPMFYGLPTVMRLFQSVGNGVQNPLTIREGRLIIEDMIKDEKVLERVCAKEKIKDREKKSIIEIKDLWFKYHKEGEFILRGVNFEIMQGEWHCMLGGNGAGKSTLLKALCRGVVQQRGKIKINGKILKEESEKNILGKEISMVPQNPQTLFTETTVEDELIEGILNQKISLKEKVEMVNNMLVLMQIEDLRNSNPYDLSGGEQQRVAIGKVLMTNPKILLMDEPTKGLDNFFKKTLAKIFNELQKSGITIFMVSHDIEFCALYGERCSMFFDGEVVSEDESKLFFKGNSFYTTAANKLFRQWNPSIVTCEEAEKWLRQVI